jgi:hypothetical protein
LWSLIWKEIYIMANRARQKGDRAEREIVHLHQAMGVPAQRVPLSGAAGGRFSGDVWIEDWKAEVKCRGNGEGFITLERWLGENDLLFLRRDRKTPLVVLPWKTYEEIIKKGGDHDS